MPAVRPRAAAAVLAVVGALAVAALAARSYRPFGNEASSSRAASTTFVDVAFTLAVLLTACLAVAAVFVRIAARRGGESQARAGGLRVLVWYLAVVLFVVGMGREIFHFRAKPQGPPEDSAVFAPGRPQVPSASEARATRQPRIVWPLVGGIAGLAVVGIAVAIVVARRRPRRARSHGEAIEELEQALDEALDDLRREPDPRKAVVAAYARMEQALSVYGIPRRRSEAPYEYLARAAGSLGAESSMARLTGLFEVARFSEHDVDETMRDNAIAALSDVRAEVRAAARTDRPVEIGHVPGTVPGSGA